MPKVWIIEMEVKKDKWMPTVGCALTKWWAKIIKRVEWENECPNDKFRIRKYVREGKGNGKN